MPNYSHYELINRLLKIFSQMKSSLDSLTEKFCPDFDLKSELEKGLVPSPPGSPTRKKGHRYDASGRCGFELITQSVANSVITTVLSEPRESTTR